MTASNQGGNQGKGGNQSGGNQGGKSSGGSGSDNQQSGDTSNRGFASMDPKQQREIAAEGGRAAHASGNAHEFTSEEARKAGSMSHKNDGNQQSDSGDSGSGSKSGGNQGSSGKSSGGSSGGSSSGSGSRSK